MTSEVKSPGEARVSHVPLCDICFHRSLGTSAPVIVALAEYDGKTQAGPWAFMCSADFANYGVGLGLGRGQRLVLVQPEEVEPGA